MSGNKTTPKPDDTSDAENQPIVIPAAPKNINTKTELKR